jgi:hypothetical protein
VIHGLQMGRSGQEFGNEFGYREGRLDLSGGVAKPGRLEGDYLKVDLVQVAAGLGARAVRATSAEVRAAVDETREHAGLVVIIVPVIPHADLPGAVVQDLMPGRHAGLHTEVAVCGGKGAATSRSVSRPTPDHGLGLPRPAHPPCWTAERVVKIAAAPIGSRYA